MNLFELIALLLVAAGLVAGLASGFGGGVWSAMEGAVWGAAKGFAIYLVVMLSILSSLALGLAYRPPFPRCRNGRCKARDYRYLSLEAGATEDAAAASDAGVVLARCACGILYSRDTRARRVCEVLADGSSVPYMHHRPCGRWRAESGEPASRVGTVHGHG